MGKADDRVLCDLEPANLTVLARLRERLEMAKRIETAQIATAAVRLVKDVLNELNWICNPLIEDFGIDFHVKVFESTGRRRALPWEFYVQVKGTTRLQRNRDFIRFSI
jgi:hypothetical protein